MNENKPVITPIGKQTWTVGEDFKIEVPISNNPDKAWAWGEWYGGAYGHWVEDRNMLIIEGHADKEKSGHFIVFATKGSHKVQHTIYYDAVLGAQEGGKHSTSAIPKRGITMPEQCSGIREINSMGYDVIATVYQTGALQFSTLYDVNGKIVIIHNGRVMCSFHIEKSESGEGQFIGCTNLREYTDIEKETVAHSILNNDK